jgi:hypothetical protein
MKIIPPIARNILWDAREVKSNFTGKVGANYVKGAVICGLESKPNPSVQRESRYQSFLMVDMSTKRANTIWRKNCYQYF